MKLSINQLENMKIKLDYLKNQYKKITNEMKIGKISNSKFYLKKIDSILKEISEIETLIGISKNENMENTISIGTIFNGYVMSSISDSKGPFYLTNEENYFGREIKVTPNSPMGLAVIGKKENDEFKYEVNGVEFNGKITEIIKRKQKIKTIVK